MNNIRFAQKRDIPKLKEIWKICFGDDDEYINLFFEKKFKEHQTLIYVTHEEIIAMLTMIPTKIVMPNNMSFNAAMIYAVATHPDYRGRGISNEIMKYSNEYLLNNNIDMSILVPAGEKLFNFYRRQGYTEGFYIKEIALNDKEIHEFVKEQGDENYIFSTTLEEYNKIRESMLKGNSYVSYGDEEISYQKALSKHSGADIYTMTIGEIKGCAIVERINAEKVMIKELLLPENLIHQGIFLIAKLQPAKEYILRLPPYLGKSLDGSTRSFGMIKFHKKLDISIKEFSYLGIAYD